MAGMTLSLDPVPRTGNYGPELQEVQNVVDVSPVIPAIVATHTVEVNVNVPGALVDSDLPVAGFRAQSGTPPVPVVVPDGLGIVNARVVAADTVAIMFLATIGYAGGTIPCRVGLLRRNV